MKCVAVFRSAFSILFPGHPCKPSFSVLFLTKGGISVPWNQIVIIVVFALLFIGLMTYLIISLCSKRSKTRSFVFNSDPFSRKFVFLLPSGLEQIGNVVEKLNVPNVGDVMRYEFDPATLKITFLYWGARGEYRLLFVPMNGHVYLRVEQLSRITRGFLPRQMTAFFREKLDAAPVEYSFYERLAAQQQ